LGGGAEGEAESLRSREPDMGLDPRILGSRPKPKADAQRLSHLGAPGLAVLKGASSTGMQMCFGLESNCFEATFIWMYMLSCACKRIGPITYCYTLWPIGLEKISLSFLFQGTLYQADSITVHFYRRQNKQTKRLVFSPNKGTQKCLVLEFLCERIHIEVREESEFCKCVSVLGLRGTECEKLTYPFSIFSLNYQFFF